MHKEIKNKMKDCTLVCLRLSSLDTEVFSLISAKLKYLSPSQKKKKTTKPTPKVTEKQREKEMGERKIIISKLPYLPPPFFFFLVFFLIILL